MYTESYTNCGLSNARSHGNFLAFFNESQLQLHTQVPGGKLRDAVWGDRISYVVSKPKRSHTGVKCETGQINLASGHFLQAFSHVNIVWAFQWNRYWRTHVGVRLVDIGPIGNTHSKAGGDSCVEWPSSERELFATDQLVNPGSASG